MFRVFSCLGGHHDLRLVALAAVVCFITSLVAINLFHRTLAAHDRARIAWLATAGIAAGSGIWATHFIAMLAYEPGVPVAYDVPLTVLSLIVAAVLMAGALGVAVVGERRWCTLLGGALIGIAVACMHFLGMLALQLPGRVTWSPDLAVAAVVLGMLFGMAAMEVTSRGTDVWTTLVASLALSAAIVGLHFTAMGAIELVPDPTRIITPLAIAPSTLAFYVAAAAALVLAIGAAGSIVDQRLSEKSEQLAAALNNMSQGLCMLNQDFEVVVVNGRFLEMFGIPADVVRPRMRMAALMDFAEQSVPFGTTSRQSIREWAQDLARDGKSGKTIFQRTDGRIFSISHEHMPKKDGWVETFEDITERRQVEDKIAYMARHDSLTDLPNRVLFQEHLEKAVAELGRGDQFAVLCLDLDHFKTVNDTLGHQGGDRLLQITAERLRGALRETDLLARCGGDEFAILQSVAEQPAGATALARRLVDVMSGPILIDGHQVQIGVSVGISLAPTDSVNGDQLLKNADMALYRAKADGRGTYRCFEPEMDARMQARRTLEIDLRRAVATNSFELHYQPIVDVESSQVTSFEALIRWRHPVRGLVAPLDFIPLAEETGLIVPIGAWVLREACAQAAEWPENVHVAVNLSAAQFRGGDLVATIADALAASHLKPARLELEITESILLQDSDATLATLHQLRALGIAISMDDFGTGYSSLSYLRKFPFDKIKIDQSFIRDLPHCNDSLAIVRAVTGLASSLGITTIAEGVETVEQFNRLKAEGCTKVQGFLFGAAKPADDAMHHLTAARHLRVVA